MKYLGMSLVLIFVAAVGWRIGGQLSPDALGMAIGMLFGIMAGIPTALLLLASQRRRDDYDMTPHIAKPKQIEQPPAPPPVVNNYITNNHYHEAPGPQRSRRTEVEQRHQLPGPAPEAPEPRRFRVVGKVDEPWT